MMFLFKRLDYLLLLISTTVLLVGCWGNSTQPAPESTPTASPGSVVIDATPEETPLPLQSNDQPISPLNPKQPISPIAPASTDAEVGQSCTVKLPESSSEMGMVCGRILAESPSSRIYLAGDIYLAPVVYGEGEVSVPFVSLNVGVDKSADVKTPDGDFAFFSVPPGQYGIVIYTPIDTYAVPNAQIDGLLLLDVEPGKTIELADIVIP